MSPEILIALTSLLLSAFFSAYEISFVSCNRLRIEIDKKQNKAYAKIIDKFFNKPSEFISCLLMGNNVSIVVYGIAMANITQPIIALYVVNKSLILAIETIIATLIVLVVSEYLPKALCRINPNRFIETTSFIAYFFYIVLYPLSSFTDFLARNFIRAFGFRQNSQIEEQSFDKIDLLNLTNEVGISSDEQDEHINEIEIFQNALKLSEVKLKECLIPRNEVSAISIDSSLEELFSIFEDTKYSRILVYKESYDKIIGYIHSKDLFVKEENAQFDISKLIRPIDFVNEQMSAQVLLASLTKNKRSIAVVLDEFGGTAGIITLEDLIEEIFGEISDELDKEELSEKQISENEFLFSARKEIKYLNKTYNLDLPDTDDYETLGGLIIYYHQSIPEQWEQIDIEKFSFIVEEKFENKLNLVKLIKRKH